ncbi:MAG: VCBS repeat-containing protein [Ferruginibacter sp.]
MAKRFKYSGAGALKQRTFHCFFIIAGSILFFSCGGKKSDIPVSPLFTLQENTGINFQNTVTDSKEENSFLFRNFYNGGGVATGDINNDGLTDVMLTSNMGENKLYLNKGNLQFEDISAKAGLKQDGMWSTGVTFADVNNDGWLDIYVCNSGHVATGNRINKLYINDHNLSFTESAAKYGLNHSGFCTQASFFDYDLDGDLDCFIINNSPLPFATVNSGSMRDKDIDQVNIDEKIKAGGNHLFRNDNGFYKEVTKEAGLHAGLVSFGLGVYVGDINNDGYPDIYVGNDFIEKDYLYINQHDGTFKDELEQRLQMISMSSMSTDVADINNDGYPEIFTTDMIPDDDYRLKTTGIFDNFELYYAKQKEGLYHQYVKNCLQLNNKNGTFSEIANYTGMFGTDWSWGALFIDADNDGLNDVYICNGINKDVGNLDYLDFFSNEVYSNMLQTGQKPEVNEILKHIPVHPLPNRVFKNQGNLQFKDVTNEWGFSKPTFSNSIAYADLDNDGDLDLIVNNENMPAFVYRNNAAAQEKNNYLGLLLKGKGKNTYAVGSKVLLYRGTEIISREIIPSRGFQSSIDYKQVIGLGKNTSVDSMIIIWPDRTFSKIEKPGLNKVDTIQQPASAPPYYFNQSTPASAILQQVSSNMDKHTEDDYIDFYYERNLPELLSKEGPKIAKADVNADGLEDIYIGGAKDQEGQLYLQTAAGDFIKKEQPLFKQYKDLEDVAVLFFDADKDGDADLYIGAGGNNVQPNQREIQHRLYKNDGKGNFAIDGSAFPNNNMNIAVAVNYDFDGDGDEDLFVGSRSVPFNYGLTPQSYLYQNDGQGHFTDVTDKMSPAIKSAGMVTAAIWADINGDNNKELIITGEWMNTKIFTYNKAGNKFDELQNTGLEDKYGWWQSIAAADVNSDGKTDLIIGNVGENFYLRPSDKNPVKLWLNDFDNNGTPEQFITKTIDGKDMPVFLKKDITDQFPGLKKQNLKHSDYATKSIQDLFGKELIEKARQKLFNYCSSIVAVNDGKGHFTIQSLPYMVQLSSVNAIYSTDLNNDNKPDLVLGGNMFEFPPQFGRLDASYGNVLLNDGKGNYKWMDPAQSGLSLRGAIKDIKEINTKTWKLVIIVQNNERPVLFQIKK